MHNKLKNIKKFNEFVTENVWLEPSFLDVAKGSTVNILSKVGSTVKDLLSKDNGAKGAVSSVGADGLIAADKIAKYNSNPLEFKSKLISICKSLKINPNWLLLVMIKESDLNPKARNPNGSASGLIQFIDSTARRLGTTISSIRNMDGVQQLDYVYKYYMPYSGRMTCVEDVYLVTFMPGYFDSRHDNTKKMGGSNIANINGVIDLDHDGQIRMGEFKQYVTKNIPAEYRDAISSKSNYTV